MLNRADLDADRRRQGIRDLGDLAANAYIPLCVELLNPSAPNHYRRVVGLTSIKRQCSTNGRRVGKMREFGRMASRRL